MAENFFALLKTEMYHNKHFEDVDNLIAHIDECIEYYNIKRTKVKLKNLTPIEYRNQALQPFNRNVQLYGISSYLRISIPNPSRDIFSI
ncbi:IS3 family transposase [Photobacterium damselae]|uniref:IS3 family transposase n=1 Tax=Photobacterium damselae TaxID=38293 RepID=UPI0040698C15